MSSLFRNWECYGSSTFAPLWFLEFIFLEPQIGAKPAADLYLQFALTPLSESGAGTFHA